MQTRLVWLCAFLCFHLASSKSSAFDSGHHWEITAQVLHEMGFSEDARLTACVSNWMLDYYSSSPTGSSTVREELSKLHCDNLYTSEAAKNYLNAFTRNSKSALVSQAQGSESHREILLLLGAVLHVVQDLYSHSTWPEHCSTELTLSNQTWYSARGKLPIDFLTGAYDPRPYVAATGAMPPNHPLHGSYTDGIHKDCHGRPYWPQAYFLAYCASREFVEALRTWLPPKRWDELRSMRLNPIEKLQLDHEVRAAYEISLWIDTPGEHGHWKGGHSGHSLMFFRSILSWFSQTSQNALWYRVHKGYRPLLDGLYASVPCPTNGALLVPGLQLKRTAVLFRVMGYRETGRSLDSRLYGKPDYYLGGGVHYGKPLLKPERLLQPFVHPIREPEDPFANNLNVLFRDRVIQNARSAENPWQTLVIADNALLARNGNILTFFLDIGEEDPGMDDVADISPSPKQKRLIFQYDVRSEKLTIPATGQTYPGGKGKKIVISGDDPSSLEMTVDICRFPTN